MGSTSTRRWQDGISLLLGIWLIVSPWIMGFRSEILNNSWNFFIVGAGFVIFAGLGLATRWVWGEWVNLALGIWLILAPWILFFNGNGQASADSISVGVIATVMSIWMLGQRRRLPSDMRVDHTLSR